MNLMDKVRVGVKLFGAKYFNKRKPLVVPFQLTSKCNLDCKYCDFEGGEEEIDFNKAKQFIKEISELGAEKVVFTGGEPFLYDGLPNLVDQAKTKGLQININSNGLLVPEKIEKVKDIDLLVLSLDGRREVHDSLRGSQSYDSVMKAVDAARRFDVDMGFTSVLSKENLSELEWLLEKARDLGIPINFQPVVCGPKGTDKNNEIGLEKEEISVTVDKICKFKEENGKIIRPSRPTLKTLEEIYRSGRRLDCGRGIIACRIEGNYLTPCARAKQSERVRIKDSFQEAWEKLSREPDCNYTCCTSSIELSNIWNFNYLTVANQALNLSY